MTNSRDAGEDLVGRFGPVTGWYAILVTAPIFQFPLGLGLWRWPLWTLCAFKCPRLNLELGATGVISDPQVGICSLFGGG
jgi:hypothetical protein